MKLLDTQLNTLNECKAGLRRAKRVRVETPIRKADTTDKNDILFASVSKKEARRLFENGQVNVVLQYWDDTPEDATLYIQPRYVEPLV